MPSLIHDGNLLLACAVAVLAGLVSFASPCVLPLVPGFLGYVTGLSGTSTPVAPAVTSGSVTSGNVASGSATSASVTSTASAASARRRTVLGALLFVLGFSAVFMVMILLATAVGGILREHQSLLERLGGLVVLALGLIFLGVGESRTGGRSVQSSVQTSWRPAAGLVGAPLLGAVFALGWTPCLGPTLGAIMALATNLAGDGAQVARGAVLGAAYCLGLGVPFLLVAAGWSRAGQASGWLRRHYRQVRTFGGVLLVLVGLLMVTGIWGAMVRSLQSALVGDFRTVL